MADESDDDIHETDDELEDVPGFDDLEEPEENEEGVEEGEEAELHEIVETEQLEASTGKPITDPSKYVSRQILTNYEMTSLIGTIATMIAEDKDSYKLILDKADHSKFQEMYKHMSPLDLAKRILLDFKVQGLCVRRQMPNGTYEDFNVSDLQIIQ